MKRTWTGSLILLAALAIFVTSEAQAQQPKRIIMGIGGSPTIFHPWDLAWQNEANHPQFYNRLVRLDKKLQPIPELAEKWEFTNNGKSLVLHLTKNARFQNGRPLTAKDVRRSWERILGKFTDSSANLAPLARMAKDVVAVDDYTVRIDYEKPNPAVFDLLDLFYIVDMDNFDKVKEQPIGSGPYRLKEFVALNRMVLVPNENYWRKPPEVELEYRVIPDPQALVLNLQTNTVDSILLVPGRDVAPLKQKGFEVWPANPDGIVLDLLLNTNWGPLKDKRVRQAINLLINRDRVHRVVYQGRGVPMCLPFHDYSVAYNADLEKRCEYNPDKAKKLLAEAGYGNGFDVELSTTQQTTEEWLKFAELLQDDLQKVGIRATVKDMDAAGIAAYFWTRGFQLQVHNYGRGNKDPGSLFGSAVVWKVGKGENVSNYYNPDLEKLVNEAAITMDATQRRQLYHRIGEVLLDDMYVTAVHTNPRYFAHSKAVSCATATVDGHMMFEWVRKDDKSGKPCGWAGNMSVPTAQAEPGPVTPWRAAALP
jgi:peptide/nickel transport system substrate-binding protein